MMRRMQTMPAGRTLTAIAAIFLSSTSSGETLYNGRPAAVLEGAAARLVIDLGGGSIVEFQLSEHGINPLRWIGPADEKAAYRPMAHFLCLDRWGPPSPAEERNGMPFHGEAARVRWKETRAAASRNGSITAEMEAVLPLAGLHVQRTVRLASNAACFTVSETVTNRNKLGRPYNMVQHPTIGPPFLDETTVVDANAQQGLMQSSAMPNPEQTAVRWPLAVKDGQPVDLRRLSADATPNVVSFVIDDEYGWVTAASASKALLVGYLWKTAEYPWLNIWRHVRDGKPFARGLEFGTTGLHQPFRLLLAKGSIFGRALFAYADPGESATRSYAAFLLRVPPDFSGVERVSHGAGRIVVVERRPAARELTIEAASLF
jgi:hypothetical protein